MSYTIHARKQCISYCFNKLLLIILVQHLLFMLQAQTLPTKVDVGMSAALTQYAASVGTMAAQEKKLAQAYQALETQVTLIDREREKQRSREVFATSYLETNVVYAKYLLNNLDLLVKRNTFLKIIPMMPYLSDAEKRLKYFKQQIALIQSFGILLFRNTHERGKLLMICTVLINKMTRVIIELSERIYKIHVFYSLLRAVFYDVMDKANLLDSANSSVFGFDYLLNIFGPFINDTTETD